jgi:hypothetical protein
MLNKIEGGKLTRRRRVLPLAVGIDGCSAVDGNGEALPYRKHKAALFEECIVRDHGLEILA